MRICYLLEGTEMWGGVKVILEQANDLHRRGVEVLLLAKGPRPDWYPLEAPFLEVPVFDSDTIPPCDFIIATLWNTVVPATASGRGKVVHFCQGYEGFHDFYADVLQELEDAYRLPTLKITVSPYLVELIRDRFHQEAHCIGQSFDHKLFFPAGRNGFPPRPRIILVGLYECVSKGITHGLEALNILWDRGVDFEAVRVSQWPRNPEEEAFSFPVEYHRNVPPLEMGELYRTCHVSISPTLEAEGFGLPALEAMACGLPCIMTQIPSLWDLDSRKDFALFVPPRSPEQMADATLSLFRDPILRRNLVKRGIETAGNYSTEANVSELLRVLREHA